jgi:hypothetical protein
MSQPIEVATRRRLLGLFVGSALVLPGIGGALLSRTAHSAEAKELDEGDPAAVALGYKKDTTQVDAAKYPQHQTSQVCGGCRYYQGKSGSEFGPCTIFAGKGVVHTNGWCAAYAAK